MPEHVVISGIAVLCQQRPLPRLEPQRDNRPKCLESQSSSPSGSLRASSLGKYPLSAHSLGEHAL